MIVSACGERCEVRPGIGFGVALAPADLASGYPGQVLELLCMRAEFQECRAQHPDTETDQGRPATERKHFLCEHFGLGSREATTAILGRPGRDRPPAFRHAFEPLLLAIGREFPFTSTPAVVVFARNGLAHVRRAMRLQPGTRLRAEFSEVRGFAHVSIQQVYRVLAGQQFIRPHAAR